MPNCRGALTQGCTVIAGHTRTECLRTLSSDLLAEGVKLKLGRSTLSLWERDSRFGKDLYPRPARQPAGCRAALSQRERDYPISSTPSVLLAHPNVRFYEHIKCPV